MTRNPESEDQYKRAVKAHDEAHTPGPNGESPDPAVLRATKAGIEIAKDRLQSEDNWPVGK